MRQVGRAASDSKSLDRLLTQLDARRYSFDPGQAAHILKILDSLSAGQFAAARPLIRFHELLLFLRAFPHNPGVVCKTETLLNTFHERVEALRQTGAEMSDFDQMEACGIASTRMEDTLAFDVANWVTRRLPGQVEIAWDHYDPGRELGTAGPRFMPLLEDDSYVEADTPWRRWLETAAGKKDSDPAWLIQRFADLGLPPNQRAELYESLRVPLRWHLENSRAARTRNWKTVRRIFYHCGPLIQRSEVSLAEELAKRPPRLTRLSRHQGEAVIETIREVMLVRYRELYGTSLADPSSVVRADVGRGVSICLWNLPPERRLPLRAYVAGLTLKNGVPLNYIEAIGLCEWMEVGFNTFYTFRGGEVGWVYAQVLRCLCCLMGTTCVSVYPYQLGQDNDEAIESGAFWFYRKLGFRCGREDLERLAEREEQKIAANRNYRTPARVLKRLAAGHVFHELPGNEVGAWDTFSTRNIGLRVNQRMARHFSGDSKRIRQESFRNIARILAVNPSSWTNLERASFENFAVVLALVPDLSAWTDAQKQTLLQIIRAKSKPDEMRFLYLTQRHDRLREALLKLGS
jgi:hypothetical protein